MEWMKKVLEKYKSMIMSTGALLSVITFIGSLSAYLADGIMDDQELHKLITSASGLELIILLLVMIFIKNRKVD